MTADPIELTARLIACPSVTPAEGGALTVIERTLEAGGFTVHRITFSEPGTPDVENLYARIGSGGPHLMFAGHTDVVPPGETAAWRHDPFSGTIDEGQLYGRGAVDMKGGIGCFMAAALDHLAAQGGRPKGSISFLITGDEEGPSVNGTEKLIAWAAARGERFDHCILGEPTNPARLGDMIKIGRRGSLSAVITVTGRQGHVAYPHLAANPIPPLIAVLAALTAKPLDAGTDHFDRSNLEITSIDVGNGATNVIPQRAVARLNIRFNDQHSLASLKAWIEGVVAKAATEAITTEIGYARGNSESFLTRPGAFVDMVAGAIAEVTGTRPQLSTSGGTSDARFIKNYCPVVEFGLVGETMHAVDERVPVADLVALTAVYRRIIDRYFAKSE
ncbi:succinyl-diaminopimelate desuccinylase [Phreatobacter sp. AB_2022a]|uniref:succinyl-diaminopimelate desuccinylase n=1 Tax=Phreatobacter sp. AB_2022a TaxID=3003134 RepID=UPI00228711B3|nr:succinyl-diaminopimelate desuccinylase [Phreatobacter sp. AB_2022a]MCZ0737565.1 succinyl-diaminopimelate desuccinylase [Phreatobacter sp. AB_2022a]